MKLFRIDYIDFNGKWQTSLRVDILESMVIREFEKYPKVSVKQIYEIDGYSIIVGKRGL